MSRKILRDRMKRAADQTPRLFSAQVYDIYPQYCRVMVQGSVNLVVAWFARNFQHRPDGVKIGGAVLCQYKLGNRGYIEVIGHGTTVPTPIAGSPTIVVPVGPDVIMTGCRVLAIPPI